MSVGKLQKGDLVSIEPWDCEGIENPWGWDQTFVSRVRSKPQRRRVKINPGSLGMIVSCSDDSDYPGYKVLVDDRYLEIHFHFLNRVNT
jgi:translation initiation factor IF-1